MYKRSSFLFWRRNTTIILIVGFILVLVAIVVAYALDHFKPTTQVIIGSGGVYNVRVANTVGERYKGLSGVEDLNYNGGLIMVFEDDGAHQIVMRDMKISIDAVWLDKEKKVIHTKRSLSPVENTKEPHGPKEPKARYILELPDGAIKNSYIRKGDTAMFELEEKEK